MAIRPVCGINGCKYLRTYGHYQTRNKNEGSGRVREIEYLKHNDMLILRAWPNRCNTCPTLL